MHFKSKYTHFKVSYFTIVSSNCLPACLPAVKPGSTMARAPVFKPGTCSRRPRVPGFSKLLWFELRYARTCMCVCVCLSVCPPPRPLITSGMIWCDIGRVRLVKQVLRLFPAFNYFIRHLPLIKWMGVAILTQHVVNPYQRKLR